MLALGIDHRSAPTSVREALAFEGERRKRGIDALKAYAPDVEFVLLSTCNRVELYAAAEATPPDGNALAAFLARFHDIPVEMLDGHLVARRDEAAVAHLFRVAAGLESLVPGEGQILGQVRDAYKLASERKAVGPILHHVFQRALRVGKRVREETGLGRGKCSVASVAVEVARAIFDRFEDKAVLVIGAGAMGDLSLQQLAALRPGVLLVTNRDPERAHAIAAPWGGRVIPFDRLDDALVEADVVLSTTAADQPIVTVDRYARIQQGRGNRLAVILDLAIPRDFDPRVGELERVTLYNVDDLRAQAEQNFDGLRADRSRPADHRGRVGRLPGHPTSPATRRGVASPARRLRRCRPPPRAGSALRRPARLDRSPAHGDRPHDVAAQQQAPASAPRRALLGR